MHLDSAAGQLHIRIVYAGAPLSGKTETLRSLLPNLHGRQAADLVASPSEARGRTLYFDWGQWCGGLFRSVQLNCQITAVAGQESLLRRRRTLVEDADAVVFVVDSQRDQMAANRRSLDEVRPWLDREGLPPVPVVYQCNKRDLPDPASLDEIRQALGLDPADVLHPCSATQGDGIRICFVASVSASVRRAEALIKLQKLPMGPPEVATPEQLLERLRLIEKGLGIDELVIDPLPPAPEAVPPAPAVAPIPTPVAAPLAPTVAAPAPAPVPVLEPPPPRGRPAVMPMADWLAAERLAAVPAAEPAPAAARTPSEAPEPVAAAPPPPPERRPAVMPMADWLARAAVQPVPQPIPLRPATSPAARPASGAAPPSTQASAVAGAAPAAPPTPRPPVMPLADLLPLPWVRGRERTLVEAWPAGAWSGSFSTSDPSAPLPERQGQALHAALGAGRLARAGKVHRREEEARAEYQRLRHWLTLLDGAASTPRCLVLSGSEAAGWCAWQLLQRCPTLDLVVLRAFDKGLASKEAAQYLAHAAHSYLAAWEEFTRREPRLPVRLGTLARQERRTVYADFLPQPLPPEPSEPVLTRLEAELRPLATPERLAVLNVPEVLRELEALAVGRPSLADIVELLQSLLIGE
jgi:signal recognition particle receptor subunit beta